MPICGKQTKKLVPYLTVQNTAYIEKTTRSQHLRNFFAAADLRASAFAAATTCAVGSAGCVDVDGSNVVVRVATSAVARL